MKSKLNQTKLEIHRNARYRHFWYEDNRVKIERKEGIGRGVSAGCLLIEPEAGEILTAVNA